MKQKLRVGVLCGGESAEHEVSLQSAKNVVAALNPEKYDVTIIGISKEGRWSLLNPSQWLTNATDPRLIALETNETQLSIHPGNPSPSVSTGSSNSLSSFDVVFPVLHGPHGEDGTVQGLLELAHIPFVGPDVLGSAIGMDKDVMKRLLRDAGIPIARFVTIRPWNRKDFSFEKVSTDLGTPLFVKPANMGSSVGVSKVETVDEYSAALEEAFRYDTKVLVEEGIKGREIECAVLGNETKRASVPGEVIPHHAFYSYEAKYIDGAGAGLEIPAKLSPELVKKVQELSIHTCDVLCCEGMSRVDMFLKDDGSLLINEINTIPGFTKISMYPKMWAATGLAYRELLDTLIQLALDRKERTKGLAGAL